MTRLSAQSSSRLLGESEEQNAATTRPTDTTVAIAPTAMTESFRDPEGRFAQYAVRQTVAIMGGAMTGAAMGLQQGATMAGLQFRAENAHRLPTSTKGWYLYHKSKNYVAMWGGIKEAGRMSTKLAFWAGAFVGVEESVDRLRRGRGSRDALSTIVAGLAIAGAFSAWNRFPLITAARTARMGLVFGVAYGLTQDAWSVLRGRPVSYVEFAKKRFGSGGLETKETAMDG